MAQENHALRSGILLACWSLGLLLSFILAAGALEDDSRIFPMLVILVMWAAAGSALLLGSYFSGRHHGFIAMAILGMALFLRLSVFDHIAPDYTSFLSVWTEAMRGMTIREALSTPIGDYNMPYLYVILLISRLPVYDLYCIKLFSVAADIALAFVLLRLAGLFTESDTARLLIFLAALVIPTGFLNSAYWGQCDGIYAAFALWGLYHGLKKRPVLSMCFFAAAFAFKLQTIFILPMVVFLLVCGYVRMRDLAAFPACFLVLMLPALLAGRSVYDTFSIYFSQTSSYPYLTLNAPSFWSMISNDYFYELDPLPVLVAGLLVLAVLTVFLLRSERLSAGSLADLSLLFCLIIPWLLPRMHERYFYLAEMLSLVYVLRHPRRVPVGIILVFGGFLIYCPYLFGGMKLLSNAMIAAIYGLTILYLAVMIFRDLRKGESEALKYVDTDL